MSDMNHNCTRCRINLQNEDDASWINNEPYCDPCYDKELDEGPNE